MQVAERMVDDAVREVGVPEDAESATVSWFAARQPGIVRYLAQRCGEHSDAMGVALFYGCAVHRAYEAALGMPPPRVLGSLLERAEHAFTSEALAPTGPGVADGLAARQPWLAQLVATVVDAPPVPLDEREATRVGVALAAVIYALDEMSTGRAVP